VLVADRLGEKAFQLPLLGRGESGEDVFVDGLNRAFGAGEQ
jgi:hypothetical protein